MPYSADLRASYCSVELNMSWFYESLSEQEIELDFKPTYSPYRPRDEQDEKECVQTTINLFEHHIEEAFKDYTVYRVFGHKKGNHDYEIYEDDVWGFLHDVALAYIKEHPKVVWCVSKEGEKGDISSHYCDIHENENLRHDGDGGYYCEECDEDSKQETSEE